MNAIDLSKYIINKCNDDNCPITNLKLSKMLYYIYGWYYAKFNKRLFKECFAAWKLGPVVTDVYFEYSEKIAEPLFAEEIELELSANEEFELNKMINILKNKTTWDLIKASRKTSAYIETYYSKPHAIISDRKIRMFFYEKLKNDKDYVI